MGAKSSHRPLPAWPTKARDHGVGLWLGLRVEIVKRDRVGAALLRQIGAWRQPQGCFAHRTPDRSAGVQGPIRPGSH